MTQSVELLAERQVIQIVRRCSHYGARRYQGYFQDIELDELHRPTRGFNVVSSGP